MAEFLDDCRTIIENAGVATFGTTLFLSAEAAPPQGAAYLLVIGYSAGSPEFVQNDNNPHYVFPGAQISAVADDYVSAFTLARNAYNAFRGQYNVTINSTFYRAIRFVTEPADGGLNAQRRPTVKFRIKGDRRQ